MNIEQKIRDVREFIEDNRRNEKEKAKPIFWSLHYDTSNHKINIKSHRSDKNYEVMDAAESMDLLERAIRRLSNQGHRWILVALRSSANDGDPLTFAFENPITQGQGQQNGIYGNGMPGMGGFQMQDMIMLLSQMYGNQIGNVQQLGTLNTQMQIQQLKHEFELKRLQDELEAEKASKGNSWIDKILGNDLIIEKVTDALLGTGGNVDDGEHQEDSQQHHPVTEEQVLQTKEKMQNSIKRMQSVFPDVADFLDEMAAFLEKNPGEAQTYRKMMKKSI